MPAGRIGDFGVSALTSFPPAVERVGTVAYHAPEVRAHAHAHAHTPLHACTRRRARKTALALARSCSR